MTSDQRARRRPFIVKQLLIFGTCLLVLAGCGAESGGTAPGSAAGTTDGTQPATPNPAGPQPPVATAPETPEPSAPPTGAASADAQLTVVVAADDGAEPVTYELTCVAGAPVGESALPDPAAACEVLASSGAMIMAEPGAGAMCTQIYGGPETAAVTGRIAGQQVATTFSREDGCAIDRWSKFESLLGTPGGVQ